MHPLRSRELSADCRDLAPPSTSPTSVFIDANDPRAQGFDVSNAQGDVPWRTLSQSGIDFVFVRASQGSTIKDRRFEQNWSMTKACAIPRGAYHVFDPGDDVDAQLELLFSMLGDDYGELPPVLDVELTPQMVTDIHSNAVFPAPAEYAQKLVAMAQAIESRTGFVPMIYIQPWYWSDYLRGSPELTRYHLWAAGSAPRSSQGWMWTFFQHGVHTRWDQRAWDHDFFHGSLEEFHVFVKSKGVVGSSTTEGK